MSEITEKLEVRTVAIEAETCELMDKYAAKNDLTFSELLNMCLASQVFKPATTRKRKAIIPALAMVVLLAIPAYADAPVITELKSEGGEHVVTVEPVKTKKSFSQKHPKIWKGLRKGRFVCNFASPFINVGAATVNVIRAL